MTEEDAKRKWCPFARAHWGGAAGQDVYQGNRFFAKDGTLDPSTSCLASMCMAWQTSEGGGFCGLTKK